MSFQNITNADNSKLWRYLFISLIIHIIIFLLIFIGYRILFYIKKTNILPEKSEITLELNQAPVLEKQSVLSHNASEDSPKNVHFESDENMKASSELVENSQFPLPSQYGIDKKWLELQNTEYTDGDPQEVNNTPSTQLVETNHLSTQKDSNDNRNKDQSMQDKNQEKSDEDTIPLPEELVEAELKKYETKPASLKPLRSSGYSPQSQKTIVHGSISNHGIASVEAEATPLGRYKKLVATAVGSRWYFYVNNKSDMISIGTVNISFQINAQGKIQSVKLMTNNKNQLLIDCSIRSVTESHLPPIPIEVVSMLKNNILDIEYSFTIY